MNHNEPLTPGRPPVETRKRDRIGPYVILKTLGEGSFGKVKLAVHQITKQKVALKIISRKKLLSKEMEGRVEREIEFLQLLRHPHIIKLCVLTKRPLVAMATNSNTDTQLLPLITIS